MGSEDPMDLPPGFRFHPTDEELITHYLLRKLVDQSFSPLAISEVDMNQVEPWSLPWMARIGEKEWYFFCLRDRKYPSGQRTNRATPSGYWKATGKDREIFRGNVLIGWKKTLVFYQGRAPTGEKSNWVSHEFRIEGSYGDRVISGIARKDWVIIRVYQKTAGGQRVSLSDLTGVNQVENGVGSSAMAPPINPQANPQDNHVVAMEAGQGGGGGGEGIVAGDPNQIPEDTMDYLGNPILSSNPFPGDAFVGAAQVEAVPIHGGNELGYPGLITPQEPLPFGSLTGNIEQNLDVEFVTGNYDIDMANYAPEQQAGTSFDLPNLEMDGTFGFGDDELQSILDCIWG